MQKNYDVCILCMNYFALDARVNNLVKSLIKLNQKILVIAYQDNNIYKDFDFIPIPINPKERLYKNLYFFTNYIKNNYKKIKSKFYLSADLYSLPATRYIQKKNNGILIYDSREIFSQLGHLHNKKLRQLFFKYLEKYYIRFVNKIIVSGNLDAEYLKEYFNHKTPYFLIMNLPFYKEKVNSNLIREKFNIDKNSKILLYQGLISIGRGIKTAIELLKFNSDYVLCIIGAKNLYNNELENFINENSLQERVFFTGEIPYEELHNWTCSADLGLSLFEPISFSYKLALPNKLFEYAMAGLPVISTNLPAIKDITNNYSFVAFADYPFDNSKLIKEIDSLLDDKKKDKIEQYSIEFAKKYNYETQINEIKKIFEIQ